MAAFSAVAAKPCPQLRCGQICPRESVLDDLDVTLLRRDDDVAIEPVALVPLVEPVALVELVALVVLVEPTLSRANSAAA